MCFDVLILVSFIANTFVELFAGSWITPWYYFTQETVVFSVAHAFVTQWHVFSWCYKFVVVDVVLIHTSC